MLTDVLVPRNRWDLLKPYPRPVPTITVIVTHFEQHRHLTRMAAALRCQTLRPSQVILADDGSSTTPAFEIKGVDTLVVSQPDQGFRAAAIRNHAARRSTGEVLVFLDADTVPEPGYLAEMVRHVARCPDVLATGRRRHTSFADLGDGARPESTELAEPSWLKDAYTATADLLHADGRSFRFMIGAVLACRRELFNDLGGFDERFVGYGGEDWDLAYRAWNAGAVLVHERDAVAWHDGPDWAGRDEDGEILDRQSARLAAVIPEPSTRGAPLPGTISDVLVTVRAERTFGHVVRTVHSLLRQTHRDLKIRLPTQDERLTETYAGVVRTDPWTEDQLRRARVRVEVYEPLPDSAIHRAVEALTVSDRGRIDLIRGETLAGVAWSTRAIGRARRWSTRLTQNEVLEHAFGQDHLLLDAEDDRTRTLDGFFGQWR
ncbi:glycosyltransferase family 2 protein [Amycolatopsis sp. cmx-11-51]|uniref:glycosyltransferase family 2 protein n=1 Tax=unclassified Amycolatopsis TaxID=2618356 RepID=UPI0039E539F2